MAAKVKRLAQSYICADCLAEGALVICPDPDSGIFTCPNEKTHDTFILSVVGV